MSEFIPPEENNSEKSRETSDNNVHNGLHSEVQPEVENIDVSQLSHTELLRYSVQPALTPVKAAILGLFFAAVIYQIAGSVLTVSIFGFDLKNANSGSLLLINTASQVFFLLLPAVFLSKILYSNIPLVLRLRKIDEKSSIVLFVAGFLLLLIIMQDLLAIQSIVFKKLVEMSSIFQSIQSFIEMIDKELQRTMSALMKKDTIVDIVILYLAIAVTPAICEEMMFRGFIQSSFELKYRGMTAAVITGIFFALFHLNPFGTIGLAVLGIYMGYAAYRSNSIWTAVVIHFLNNAFAVTVYILFNDADFTGKADSSLTFGDILPRFSILVALFAGIIYLIEKKISIRSLIEKQSGT